MKKIYYALLFFFLLITAGFLIFLGLIFLKPGLFFGLDFFGGKNIFFQANTDNSLDSSLGIEPEILKKIFGFGTPANFLVLFLNNTELRPGGGFIGSYGVVKAESGRFEIIKTEGSELLDFRAGEINEAPPWQLEEYLKIKNKNFRDSNWSPDFSFAAKESLDIYKEKNGVLADDINVVVGITPDVLEKILEILGSIEYDGVIYTSENFTEKLEYQVEYGYQEQGLDSSERKEIIGGLANLIFSQLKKDILFNWKKYYLLFNELALEKQIVFYSTDINLQDYFENNNFAGRVKAGVSNEDYIFWVDANLGAWKTDASLDREITYKIRPTESGRYVAELEMNYIHNGRFDWRTSRYLSYVRIFVPIGSELIEVVGQEKSEKLNDLSLNSGLEMGVQDRKSVV